MDVEMAIRTAAQFPATWARPVAWRGEGRALWVDGDKIMLMAPGAVGPWRPRATDLVGDWETVAPDDVHRECDQRTRVA